MLRMLVKFPCTMGSLLTGKVHSLKNSDSLIRNAVQPAGITSSYPNCLSTNKVEPSACCPRAVPYAEKMSWDVAVATEVQATVSVEVAGSELVKGLNCAVWIAAALAVPATMVNNEFESNGLLDSGAESPGMAQARLAVNNSPGHRMDLILSIFLLFETKIPPGYYTPRGIRIGSLIFLCSLCHQVCEVRRL